MQKIKCKCNEMKDCTNITFIIRSLNKKSRLINHQTISNTFDFGANKIRHVQIITGFRLFLAAHLTDCLSTNTSQHKIINFFDEILLAYCGFYADASSFNAVAIILKTKAFD